MHLAFFATSHGKGAVDGIGGEVKWKASILALSGRMQERVQIQNAAQFVCVFENRISFTSLFKSPLFLIPENCKMFDRKSGPLSPLTRA